MTAEAAVINSRGVALAADSAVTIGGGEKIFNTSSKIARLSDVDAIGVMTYGNAGFIGLNWDLVFSEYRRARGREHRAHLQDCVDDFLDFLASEERLFSAQGKHKWLMQRVYHHIGSVLEAYARVMSRVDEDDDAELARISEAFMAAASGPRSTANLAFHGERGLADYEGAMADAVAAAVSRFERDHPRVRAFPGVTTERLVNVGTNALMGGTDFDSGLVFAGYGNEDTFPGLVELKPVYVADGSVLYMQGVSDILSHDNPAGHIYPFAQSEVVHSFLRGIDAGHYFDGDYTFELDDAYDSINIPAMTWEMLQRLLEHIDAAVDAGESPELAELSEKAREEANRLMGLYMEKLSHAVYRYAEPVLDAVNALTKEGLAEIAEELIEMTALRRRFALGAETVGGPVDVAVITRSDGFVWVKRKHYFDPQFNQHLAEYQEAQRDV
jgi:hypothetical protein